MVYSLLTENSVCKVHLHKELKGERDISLIKILDFPVAMRFIVYRYKDSVKIMFLTSQGDFIVLNGFWNQLRFCTSGLC